MTIYFDDLMDDLFVKRIPKTARFKKIPHHIHMNKDSTIAYIVFQGWLVKEQELSLLKLQLHKKYTYVTFDFPPDVVSADPALTLRYIRTIIAQTKKVIGQLKKRGVKEFRFIMNSLGCMPGLKVASEEPLVKKLIMVAPAHDWPDIFWKAELTTLVRERMQATGVTLKQLREYWQEIIPSHYLSSMKGRDVTVYLSKRDVIVTHQQGLKVVHLLRKKGAKVIVYENEFLGHQLTTIKHFILLQDID